MSLLSILKHVTNSVSSREEFNEKVEKNLKVKAKADEIIKYARKETQRRYKR